MNQTVPPSLPHRIGAGLFAAAMLASAALQLNDPDPWVWVAMYVYLGLLCALAAVRGVLRPLVWVGLLVALVWAGSLAPSVYELFAHHPAGDLLTGMSPDRPYVEEARESLGLCIGVLAMAHLLFAARRR